MIVRQGFVRAKRKTNIGNVIGQQKEFAAKKLDQFLYFFTVRANEFA